MNKKVLFFGGLLVLISLGVAYFFALNKKNIGNIEKQISLENFDQVFNIQIPDDFDENRKERLNEKLTEAKKLYNESKNDNWTWIVIGNMYEFIHDYDRAVLAYKNGIKLNEYDMISAVNLANIYENQKKDFALAEEYYKKAIEISTQNPEFYINLAKLYEFKMKLPQKSEEIYKEALIATNNNPDALVEIITFYERQKNMEKRKEYAAILLNLYPDNEFYQKNFSHLVK